MENQNKIWTGIGICLIVLLVVSNLFLIGYFVGHESIGNKCQPSQMQFGKMNQDTRGFNQELRGMNETRPNAPGKNMTQPIMAQQ
jgi:hypothetical protein